MTKTKKIIAIFLLLLSILLATACNGSKNQTMVQQGPVNDFAGVLSGPEKEALAELLTAYEKETCHQVVVVIVPELAGEKMAQAWKIGQQFLDNGILVSIAVQEGKARIDTGAGLDRIVKDGLAATILQQAMFPHFRQGRFGDGLRSGLEALMREARKTTYPPDHRPSVCL
jgi:uncharacterized protein